MKKNKKARLLEETKARLLEEAARSDDKTVRMAAIRSLARGRPSSSIPPLMRAEADPDPLVRELTAKVQKCFPHEVAMFRRDQEQRQGQTPKKRKRTLIALRERHIPDRDEQYPK